MCTCYPILILISFKSLKLYAKGSNGNPTLLVVLLSVMSSCSAVKCSSTFLPVSEPISDFKVKLEMQTLQSGKTFSTNTFKDKSLSNNFYSTFKDKSLSNNFYSNTFCLTLSFNNFYSEQSKIY